MKNSKLFQIFLNKIKFRYNIDSLISTNLDKFLDDIQVFQIKQKFGSLRIYFVLHIQKMKLLKKNSARIYK